MQKGREVRKPIRIMEANWKSKGFFGVDSEELFSIVTLVLEQDGFYFDPSDSKFLDIIFREFAKKKLEKGDRVILPLSASEVFFFEKNKYLSLLNAVYGRLFPYKKQDVFTSITESTSGDVSLGIFNLPFAGQLECLIEIIEELGINFKKASKEYMVLGFPYSLNSCKREKIKDLVYQKVKTTKWII